MGDKFNENLKIAREKKNMTQKEIADIIGVAKSTYSLYESGNREPNVQTIKKIADVNSPQKELGALAKMANAPSSKFSDLIGVIVLCSFRSVQCQHP